MDNHELYSYNFNSTHPLPPPMSSTSISLCYLALLFSALGFLISSTLIYKIIHHNLYEKYSRIVTLASFDVGLRASFIFVALVPALSYGRVPSEFNCNLQGFCFHWLCICSFSCITAMAFDRLESLRVMTKQKPHAANHFYYLMRFGFPLIGLFAALPVITDGNLGIYALKPNSSLCFAHGGKGVLRHDIFFVLQLIYLAAVCFAIMVYSLYQSQLMITNLLKDRAKYSAKAAKARQDSLYFAVGLILLFLAAWSLVAVHGVLLTFGMSADWPPLFFDFIPVTVAGFLTLNSVFMIYYDEGLKKMFSRKRRRAKAGSVASVLPGTRSVIAKETQAHNGSRVSHFDSNGSIKSFVSGAEADSVSRQDIAESLFVDRDYVYSKNELHNLAHADAFLAYVEGKFKPLKQANGLVELGIFTPEDSLAGLGLPALHATATVRTSVEEAVAFLHDFDSHDLSSKAALDRRVRERFVLEILTERSIVTYARYKPSGRRRRDRTMCSMSTCAKQDDNGSVLYATFSTTHDGAPETDEYARASEKYVWRFSSTQTPTLRLSTKNLDFLKQNPPSASETVVELFTQLDFGFDDEKVQLNSASRPLTVAAISSMQRYFLYQCKLEDLGDKDGSALATMIVDAAQAQHAKGTTANRKYMARFAVNRVIEKSKALKQIKRQHVWFAPLLKTALLNMPLPPTKVSTPLAELTANEGHKIGRSLSAAMISNVTPEAGVDEWFRTFPAMVEFEEQQTWFRSFMNTLVRRKLSTTDMGAAARLYFGALLSTGDMITDVVMIVKYFAAGRSGFAWICLGLIATCIAVQLCAVYFQHHKKPKGMKRDMLLVATCLKPAADAYKTASGQEGEDHHAMPPKVELVFFRIIEMACESIPGGVLQLLAIIGADSAPGATELLSVTLSIMTTAFAGSVIAYDFDCDPEKRMADPLFYGYVPDDGRMTVMALMMAMAFCQIAVRSLCMALLLNMSHGWIYLVELGVYVLYKAARGDFFYWMPATGVIQWTVAVGSRVFVKIIADFTCCFHFRHPYELGGLYFSANLLMGHLGVFAATYFYCEIGREGAVITNSLLWITVGGTSSLFFVLFLTFLITIDEGYGRTFFSSKTSRDCVEDKFRLYENPASRLAVLSASPHLLVDIREDLKAYIGEKWEEWERERPPFWTAKFIRNIPDDMLPAAKQKLRGGGRGSNRAKMSVFESIFEADDEVEASE